MFDALNINIATHQQINQIVFYCILKVFFTSDTTLKKENRVMCQPVLAPVCNMSEWTAAFLFAGKHICWSWSWGENCCDHAS